ncbi:YceD family protein [Salana multivorans]
MDTRSPFVVGVHDLVRRPGAMRVKELGIPAPADLRNEVIGVPEGAEIAVDLRLESVVEGVLATAQVTAPLVGECVRCLATIEDETDVEVTELFAYPGAIQVDPEDTEAEEIAELHEDAVDLEQAIRDAIVLDLPFQPRCRPDCAGLCPQCGTDLNAAGPEHSHDVVDARWAALVEAFGEASAETKPTTSGEESDR